VESFKLNSSFFLNLWQNPVLYEIGFVSQVALWHQHGTTVTMETKVCVYYFFCHQLSLLDTCKNTFTVFPKDVPPIVTIILSNLYQFWNSFTAGNFIKFPAKQSVTLAITPKTCCRLATLPQEPYSKCSVFFVAVFAYYTAHKYCFSGVCLCVWLSVCVRATNDKLPVTDW